MTLRVFKIDSKTFSLFVDKMVSTPSLHNVLFGQYFFLPTEQAETYHKICLDISFNTYLSQHVRLEGKLDYQGTHDFQTLNLEFPGHFDRL